ncbi:MAG: hypothetical protein N2246_05115 [Candidatus Sumerlaeia bacterium]|nr:hypothetical protein [Candidatus Sumerlaeia bacterium]
MVQHRYINFFLAVLIWIITYWILYVIAPAIPVFDTRKFFIHSHHFLPMVSGVLLLFTTLFIYDCSPHIKMSPLTMFSGLFALVIIDNYAHKFDSLGYGWSFLISDLAIIFIGVLLGKLLASSVAQRSWIIPIALVAMVADVWSVTYGPSYYISTQPPKVLRHFMLFYPLLGASTTEATIIPYWLRPFVGMGDVIFIALYLELVRKYELHIFWSRLAMTVAMMIPITLASLAGKGVPALPFMSAFFVFTNFRYLEVKKNELIQCVIFICVMMAILFTIYHNPATRAFLSLER